MDWKELFEKKILDRGRDYFKSGYVSELEITDSEINTVVEGTEDYEVHITLAAGEVADMECTCPYAEDGWDCKHMAAVLYAYNAAAKAPKKPDKKQPSLEELVAGADEQTVRDFLLGVLKEDKALLLKFRTLMTSPGDSIDAKLYQNHIDRIIREHGGRDGFIEYRDAGRFIREMEKVLYDEIVPLADTHLIDAFKLSLYLFREVSNADMDDSDGHLGGFGNDVLAEWETMINKSDSAQKQQMLELFLSHLDGSVIDYMEEFIEAAVFDDFDEPEHLSRKLEFIDDRLTQLLSAKDRSEYYISSWLMKRLDMMEQLEFSEDEISEFCKKYYEFSDIRERMTDSLIEQKNYDRAIGILKDSLELDRDKRGLVRDCHLKLKVLYKLIGDDKGYHDELWELAVRFSGIEELRELRSLHPDDWAETREKLFAEADPHDLPEFYKEEKLFDRLRDYIKAHCNIYTLRNYESILSEHYPAFILEKYAAWLRSAARNTADRKTYAEWAARLKKMSKWKGGKEVVAEVVKEWREVYAKRPAMMQELDIAKL
ncbi:MAG: SWIM zinc finger family protein [Ruminococcus sp.]|nr:SWIM zinc finger family protein [Ruminococcus sp.]